MKKSLFTLLFTLICLGSNAQLGYWVSGEFIELNLDESYDYRFVQAMDAESQNVLSNLYASMATKGNPSLLRIQDNQFFVDIDYCLPEGNYYESPIFKDTEGYNYIILPRLVLTLMDNFQIDDILEYLNFRK